MSFQVVLFYTNCLNKVFLCTVGTWFFCVRYKLFLSPSIWTQLRKSYCPFNKTEKPLREVSVMYWIGHRVSLLFNPVAHPDASEHLAQTCTFPTRFLKPPIFCELVLFLVHIHGEAPRLVIFACAAADNVVGKWQLREREREAFVGTGLWNKQLISRL